MAIIHQSRTGKTYYLHAGPKRGGGVQHFFSTKPTGTLALCLCVAVGLADATAVAVEAAGSPRSFTNRLAYAPAPLDNPLKAFVPYLRTDPTFPHSLEWDYTKLSDVMTGPTNFNWSQFEAKLNAATSRGHQFVARSYLEWPGKTARNLNSH